MSKLEKRIDLCRKIYWNKRLYNTDPGFHTIRFFLIIKVLKITAFAILYIKIWYSINSTVHIEELIWLKLWF